MFDPNDFDALRRLGLHTSLIPRPWACPPDDERLMRVVEVQRDRCTLHDGHQLHEARLWPALQARLQVQGEGLTVGDWVLARPDGCGGHWISASCRPTTAWCGAMPAGTARAWSAMWTMRCW
jgi:hypothetical protein